jgi:hypothetical protein
MNLNRRGLLLQAGLSLGFGRWFPSLHLQGPKETVPDSPTSVGRPGIDGMVTVVPAGASRYWYAAPSGQAPNMTTSARPNAYGESQSLYYDLYGPTRGDERKCALFVHGGGFVAGYTADDDANAVIARVRRLGYWVAAIEYRRGWETAEQLAEELELALTDVRDAWAHLHTIARSERGFSDQYVPIGRSAGSVVLSRLALAGSGAEGLPGTIAGLVLGYGTPLKTDVLRPCSGKQTFPVVIQGGLFDSVNPAFDNFIYCKAELRKEVVGYFHLYRKLSALGYPCRMYVGAQDGHGFGVYKDAAGEPTYFDDALTWFKSPSGPNWKEYKFAAASDPNWAAHHAGRPYPGPRSTMAGMPDSWEYSPYEKDLSQAGRPNPQDVAKRWNVTWGNPDADAA